MPDFTSPAAVPFCVNGRYEIQGPAVTYSGAGLMYRAHDLVTLRPVVLRTMPAGLDPAAIAAFEREWTVLARLRHPNIIEILDTGEFYLDGRRHPYFVTPLLRGATLEGLIREPGPRLPVKRVIEIISQACQGLQAAHDQGLFHGEIRPDSIFVADDGAVKVMDFGVAHPNPVPALSDPQATRLNGTLAYLAPEQLEAKLPTAQSDVFSLGAVCYQALTGQSPFARATEAGIKAALRMDVPPPANELNPTVSSPLSRTVEKALAKQSWQRFASVRQFGAALKGALPSEAPNPPADKALSDQGESNRDAFAEARRCLAGKDFSKVQEICAAALARHPDDPLFLALRMEAEGSQRQQQYAAVAAINGRLEAEPDLDRKLTILTGAMAQFPAESHFQETRKLLQDRRDLVQSIVGRARSYESQGQLDEAANQWDILQNIYPFYPDLASELQHLADLRAKQASVQPEAAAPVSEAQDRGKHASGPLTQSRPAPIDDRTGEDPFSPRRHVSTERRRQALIADAGLPTSPSGSPLGKEQEKHPSSASPSPVPLVGLVAGTPAKAFTRAGSRAFRPYLIWIAVLAFLLLIPAAWLVSARKKAPLPASVRARPEVSLTANVPGAHFTLDGQSVTGVTPLPLSLGDHKAEATLDGYSPDRKTFTVTPHDPAQLALSFVLQPLLAELRVTSDLKSGRYVLDQNEPVDLLDGSLVRDNILPGEHSLTILDGNRPVFFFTFNSQPNEPPKLSEPLGAKLMPGVLICALAGTVRVYATPGLRGSLEGQPALLIPAEGLTVPLPAGNAARFVLEEGNGQTRTIAIEHSSVPVISVSLSGASERIPLVINANVPDGAVSLNGVPLKRGLAGGVRTVLLLPGSYRIRVSQEGYQDPPEQTVVLKAGDPSPKPLDFLLTAIPHPAILSVAGAPAGAEILVDGARQGSVSPAGAFSAELAPGPHQLIIHKPNFEDFRESLDLRPATTTRVTASSMQGPGVVNVKVTPQNATVLYQRDGDPAPSEALNNHSLDLRPGVYHIAVSAENYIPRKDVLTVVSGKPYDLAWGLKPKSADIPSAGAKRSPAEVFENGESWQVINSFWIHFGKGLSFTRRREGVFIFDFLNPKDARELTGIKIKRIAFMADYTDSNNAIFYTVEGRTLSREVLSNGKSAGHLKIPIGRSEGMLRLTIQIAPDTVTIRNAAGLILDSLPRAIHGRFGFADEVALRPAS